MTKSKNGMVTRVITNLATDIMPVLVIQFIPTNSSGKVFYTTTSKEMYCTECFCYYSGGSRISPRRGCQLPGGAPTYEFAKFSQKLHEIERIWTPGGGARVPRAPPLDPPMVNYTTLRLCLNSIQ